MEQRWDPSQNGQIVPDDKRVGRKLADDAMYKVEHQKSDLDKSGDAAPRISQLSQIQVRTSKIFLYSAKTQTSPFPLDLTFVIAMD